MFPNILYHQNLSNGNIFVTNNFITKLVNVSHGKYSCSVLNHSSSAPLASMMSHSHSLQQSSHTLSPAHKKTSSTMFLSRSRLHDFAHIPLLLSGQTMKISSIVFMSMSRLQDRSNIVLLLLTTDHLKGLIM